MILDIDKILEKLNFAYDSVYSGEKDDAGNNVDWLEGNINGIYTQEEDNDLWIVIRGTDQNSRSEDTNMKLLAHRLPYVGVNPKIWVHTGLIDIYDTPNFREVVRKKVRSFLNKNLTGKVWVIGHSQGGGMAQICAVDLQYAFGDAIYDRLFVVPVSPMRAGNKHFAASYERRIKNSFIIWRGSDSVPVLLPPGLFGYKLPGIRVQLNKRPFLSKLWNFVAAPIAFLFFGRKKFHKNTRDYVSFLSILFTGPDWYFVNDHDIDDWPKFTLETNTLKFNNINKIKIK